MNNSSSASPGPTERIEVYLDDLETPAEIITEAPFHVDLDTAALANGEHTLRVVRFDAAGRSTERIVPFVVNNEPEPDITGLEPGATVAGRVGIDFAPPAPPPLPRRVGISPWWYFVGSAVIFLGVYLFFILVPAYHILAPSGGKEAAAASAPVDQALMSVGEKVYGDNCVACHQQAGTGMPPAIPALAGNTALGDVDTVLKTIHDGAGAMQAFSSLDAQQLAGVATYVRNSWGNGYGGVSADQAASVTGAVAPVAPAAPKAEGTGTPSAPAAPAAPAAPKAEAITPSAPAAPAAPVAPAAPAAPKAEATTPSAPAAPAAPKAEEATPSAPTAPAAAAPSQPQAAAPAAPAAVGGTTRYVDAPTKLVASDGTELGTLSIGAKLNADGQANGKTNVTVDGWSMKGAESVIFLAMGTRVDVAMLTDAGQKAVHVVQTKDDDYGTTWMEVSLTGLADAQGLVGDSQSLWTKASGLYSSSCSACHALHSPDTYTANQWPGTLKSMIPNTALTPDQVGLITKYLQYHAKGM